MKNFDDLPDIALVRLKDLLAPRGPLPFSKSTMWAGCKSGRFPQPIRIGRITAWRVNDIRDFLTSVGNPQTRAGATSAAGKALSVNPAE